MAGRRHEQFSLLVHASAARARKYRDACTYARPRRECISRGPNISCHFFIKRHNYDSCTERVARGPSLFRSCVSPPRVPLSTRSLRIELMHVGRTIFFAAHSGAYIARCNATPRNLNRDARTSSVEICAKRVGRLLRESAVYR